jgi:hypothetical protein
LAGPPSEKLRQKCFSNAGIADQYDVGPFSDEGEIEQAQEPRFGLHAALVVMEVEGVDTGLCLQTRAAETPLNGT